MKLPVGVRVLGFPLCLGERVLRRSEVRTEVSQRALPALLSLSAPHTRPSKSCCPPRFSAQCGGPPAVAVWSDGISVRIIFHAVGLISSVRVCVGGSGHGGEAISVEKVLRLQTCSMPKGLCCVGRDGAIQESGEQGQRYLETGSIAGFRADRRWEAFRVTIRASARRFLKDRDAQRREDGDGMPKPEIRE